MSPHVRTRYEYGLSDHVFAFPKPQGNAIVIGGASASRLRWTRVLSFQAASMLWASLAQLLDPQRAQDYLSRLATLTMREPDKPTITTSVIVDITDEGGYEVYGISGQQIWSAVLSETDARALWRALSIALRAQANRRRASTQ